MRPARTKFETGLSDAGQPQTKFEKGLSVRQCRLQPQTKFAQGLARGW